MMLAIGMIALYVGLFVFAVWGLLSEIMEDGE